MFTIRDGHFLSPLTLTEFRDKKKVYKSIYHYYVYHKFADADSDFANICLKTKRIRRLIKYSNSRRYKTSPRWKHNKNTIMKNAYEVLFYNYPQYLTELSQIGKLRYNSPYLKYWSSGNLVSVLETFQPQLKRVVCKPRVQIVSKPSNIQPVQNTILKDFWEEGKSLNVENENNVFISLVDEEKAMICIPIEPLASLGVDVSPYVKRIISAKKKLENSGRPVKFYPDGVFGKYADCN